MINFCTAIFQEGISMYLINAKKYYNPIKIYPKELQFDIYKDKKSLMEAKGSNVM